MSHVCTSKAELNAIFPHPVSTFLPFSLAAGIRLDDFTSSFTSFCPLPLSSSLCMFTTFMRLQTPTLDSSSLRQSLNLHFSTWTSTFYSRALEETVLSCCFSFGSSQTDWLCKKHGDSLNTVPVLRFCLILSPGKRSFVAYLAALQASLLVLLGGGNVRVINSLT